MDESASPVRKSGRTCRAPDRYEDVSLLFSFARDQFDHFLVAGDSTAPYLNEHLLQGAPASLNKPQDGEVNPVDRVIICKKRNTKSIVFLVAWSGFNSSHWSWEPLENLSSVLKNSFLFPACSLAEKFFLADRIKVSI